MSELAQVSIALKSKSITILPTNQWLVSCVDCFKSQTPNYTAGDLFNFVFEQWLLADLRDIKSGTLPPSCTSANKMIITGSHAVQLNYAVNVAGSMYKQLQKIRRPDSEKNLEATRQGDEPGGGRALKMQITDGVTTTFAFEDKPVRCLKFPVPGEKLVLKGPIEVRKGCLMLGDNVDSLGGEVDTLLIPNATENVLARLLGEPENPDPYGKSVVATDSTLWGDDDVFAMVDDGPFLQARPIPSNPPLVPTGNHQTLPPLPSAPRPCFNHHNSPPPNRQSSAAPCLNRPSRPAPQSDSNVLSAPRKSLYEAAFDEIDLSHDDFEQIASQEAATLQRSAALNDPDQLRQKLVESYGTDQPLTSDVTQPIMKSMVLPRPSHEKGKILVDYLEGIVLPEENMSQPQVETRVQPRTDEPFPPQTYPSTRRAPARVLKLPQRLTIKEGKWCLSALIAVRGLELEMDFDPGLLDRIFGISAEQLSSKKAEVKSNPAVKEQINETLRASQQKIRSLCCDMTIQFNSFISNPIITDVFDN